MGGLRPRLGVLVCLLVWTGLWGCGAPSLRAPEGELRINLRTEPPTLDWSRATDNVSVLVIEQLMQGLTRLGSDLRAEPALAERWEVSPDGLTYTFHLRPSARWSNGDHVTADHFLAGFQRTLSPDTNSTYAFLLESLLDVSATDDATLVIELHSPTPYLLSVLSMPIAFPLWHDGEIDAGQFSELGKFVGNGAYLLDEWLPGAHIRLRKNPEFHDSENVAIDFVEYYAVQDLLSELNMYRAGQLDITASVPGSHVNILRESHGGELQIAPSLALYYVAFDLSESPLDNTELRQALKMAVDREALVTAIEIGRASCRESV